MCIPLLRRHRRSDTITNHPYRRLPSPPPSPRMPKPISSPVPSIAVTAPPRSSVPSASVSTQHERLLVELLPFKHVAKFREWLGSVYVRGSWDEFRTDFLAVGGAAAVADSGGAALPEPDKARTAQAAREALNSRSPRYMVYRPDKTGWTADDHYVRFIVTLVADNMLQNLWYESEWKKRGLDIAKSAYEVLIFLKATLYVDPDPPSYSA